MLKYYHCPLVKYHLTQRRDSRVWRSPKQRPIKRELALDRCMTGYFTDAVQGTSKKAVPTDLSDPVQLCMHRRHAVASCGTIIRGRRHSVWLNMMASHTILHSCSYIGTCLSTSRSFQVRQITTLSAYLHTSICTAFTRMPLDIRYTSEGLTSLGHTSDDFTTSGHASGHGRCDPRLRATVRKPQRFVSSLGVDVMAMTSAPATSQSQMRQPLSSRRLSHGAGQEPW